MIGLFHPIYGSGIPKIFRNYLDELTELVDDLNIDGFTITTVALFSGDGAIVTKKYFDGMKVKQIYAYNIKMPSNINLPILGIVNTEKQKTVQRKAKIEIEKIVNEINENNSHISGTNILSRLGGMFQRSGEKYTDEYEVKINHSICIKCGLCVQICPVNNLTLTDHIETYNNCTQCLRCLNNCPTNAIRYFSEKGSKPFKQLKSLENNFYKNMD